MDCPPDTLYCPENRAIFAAARDLSQECFSAPLACSFLVPLSGRRQGDGQRQDWLRGEGGTKLRTLPYPKTDPKLLFLIQPDWSGGPSSFWWNSAPTWEEEVWGVLTFYANVPSWHLFLIWIIEVLTTFLSVSHILPVFHVYSNTGKHVIEQKKCLTFYSDQNKSDTLSTSLEPRKRPRDVLSECLLSYCSNVMRLLIWTNDKKNMFSRPGLCMICCLINQDDCQLLWESSFFLELRSY